MRSWYRIEENRGNPGVAEIYLHDEIGAFGVTSKEFITDLRAINAGRIKLHINSPGGVVDDAVAIYNALLSHSAIVDSYIDAAAYSAASWVALAAGKTGKVITAPHSRWMIHEAMTLGFGNAGEMEKTAARLRSLTQTIGNIYAERTGKPADHWLALMAEETWFTDQGAVDAGLADEIGRDYDVANFQIAANFNLSRFRNAAPIEVPEAAPAELNLEDVHNQLATLGARHTALCEGGDGCPLTGDSNTADPASTKEDGDEPAPPPGDAERREAERIDEMVALFRRTRGF